MVKEIIAIDGPAASGKSTVAKLLAKELGYIYIDSGAMYRCIALYVLRNNINLDEIKDHLQEIKIGFDQDDKVYLNGEDVSELIRDQEVSNLVADVAQLKEVREYLVSMQKEYGKAKGVVMDGRDIGTVVFKDAKVKIYQVASAKARAMRRHKENLANGRESNLDNIIEEIEQRDHADMSRSISPLTKAEDAIVVDTSDLSIEESVKAILDIFNKKVKEND